MLLGFKFIIEEESKKKKQKIKILFLRGIAPKGRVEKLSLSAPNKYTKSFSSSIYIRAKRVQLVHALVTCGPAKNGEEARREEKRRDDEKMISQKERKTKCRGTYHS